VLLARAGSVIPTSVGDLRGFLLFPLLEGETSGQSYEDDGESEAYREGGFGSWHVGVDSEAGVLQVSVSRSGQVTSSQNELVLLLPGSELRPVKMFGALLLEDDRASGQRRLRVRLQ
jgi:alpha-glucosidase